MRGAQHQWLCWAAVITSLVFATAASAEAPSTAPAPQTTRVLVLPFASLSDDPTGRAGRVESLARNLSFDLSTASSISCAAGDEVAPDAEAAVAAGKVDGAKFVVWGTVQTVGDRTRVAVQVLDVAAGEPAGRFKLTGTTDDWFELQDAVSERVTLQVVNAVARDAQADGPTDGQAPVAKAPTEVPAGEPLRLRRSTRAERPPDWAAPGAQPDRFGELARRQEGREYWTGGYYGYGYRYGYRRYGNARFRWGRYTYRGLPDDIAALRYGPRGFGRFLGPVPLRWFRR